MTTLQEHKKKNGISPSSAQKNKVINKRLWVACSVLNPGSPEGIWLFSGEQPWLFLRCSFTWFGMLLEALVSHGKKHLCRKLWASGKLGTVGPAPHRSARVLGLCPEDSAASSCPRKRVGVFVKAGKVSGSECNWNWKGFLLLLFKKQQLKLDQSCLHLLSFHSSIITAVKKAVFK